MSLSQDNCLHYSYGKILKITRIQWDSLYRIHQGSTSDNNLLQWLPLSNDNFYRGSNCLYIEHIHHHQILSRETLWGETLSTFDYGGDIRIDKIIFHRLFSCTTKHSSLLLVSLYIRLIIGNNHLDIDNIHYPRMICNFQLQWILSKHL